MATGTALRPWHWFVALCIWFAAAFPTPTQNDKIAGRLSQGLKGVFQACAKTSTGPLTRSVEFPKVALLAHGTRRRP